jgi:peptidase A4-like protein
MTLKSWLAGGVVAGAALMAAPAAVASAHPVSDAGPGPTVQVHGMRAAVGVRLPATHLPHLAPQMSVTSNNWSGYAAVADSGVRIRFVSANFNIPSLNCANSPLGSSGFAYAGHWAGLDGFNDATVEQTGVDAFCDSSGTPTYYAWYEMYPLAPVAFTGVNPGDAIHVSVFFTGSAYDLALTDLTTGGSIDTTQPCPSGSTCHNKSAEVITEDPGGAVAGGFNLADFGMANYTGATVTSIDGSHGTLAAQRNKWTSTEIIMEDSGGTMMAVPSALEGGQAFNVAWRSAS